MFSVLYEPHRPKEHLRSIFPLITNFTLVLHNPVHMSLIEKWREVRRRKLLFIYTGGTGGEVEFLKGYIKGKLVLKEKRVKGWRERQGKDESKVRNVKTIF